jgi:hypothetical protein
MIVVPRLHRQGDEKKPAASEWGRNAVNNTKWRRVMAKNFVSWVHGYAAVAEWMGPDVLQFDLTQDPTRGGERDLVPAFSDVNGWRRAWGSFFRLRGDKENWFHIPIPTPQLVEDRRAGLDRVMALFRIDGGMLQRVLVFDGPNLILDRGGLDASGDHTHDLIENANVFPVNHDEIAFGVGFSLNFKPSGNGADRYIASVGGIFFHDI